MVCDQIGLYTDRTDVQTENTSFNRVGNGH